MRINLIAALLFFGLINTSSVLAQDSDSSRERMPCPRPTSETLGLKATPTPVAQDFSPGANAAVQAGVNDPVANRFFRHTFQWNPRRCCQIMSATLTVTTMANDYGTGQTGSDAGNDMIAVVHMGATVPGLSQYLYATPVAPGTVTTRTLTMNATALANMEATNRLSFNVQDDSRVTKAVLHIERCCVGKE